MKFDRFDLRLPKFDLTLTLKITIKTLVFLKLAREFQHLIKMKPFSQKKKIGPLLAKISPDKMDIYTPYKKCSLV